MSETGQDLEGTLKFYISEYDKFFRENHDLRAKLADLQHELMLRDGEIQELKRLLPYGYINVLSQQTKEINLLAAQLADAQKEIEILKHNANEKLNLCRDHWQRGMRLNIERAEKAESENAELRARLTPVEEVYRNYNHGKGLYCDIQVVCDLWQAIKAACEKVKSESTIDFDKNK